MSLLQQIVNEIIGKALDGKQISLDDEKQSFLGISAPHLHFYSKPTTNSQEIPTVGAFENRTLHDFIGLVGFLLGDLSSIVGGHYPPLSFFWYLEIYIWAKYYSTFEGFPVDVTFDISPVTLSTS